MKPVVLLIPLVDDERDSLWMLPGYMEGLAQAGALPLMAPLTAREEDVRQLFALCDGVLLTGGHDVSPSLYGQARLPVCGACSPRRDAMETALLALALAADKPVLGICRGVQLVNAALGGTLWQDLPSQRPSATGHHQRPPYDVPAHGVTLLPGTPLRALLGRDSLPVNSYHHQAVRDLAPPLRAMAVAEDGLVEAVYHPQKRFLWGVQWHPEFSFQSDPASRAIFGAFARACGGKT